MKIHHENPFRIESFEKSKNFTSFKCSHVWIQWSVTNRLLISSCFCFSMNKTLKTLLSEKKKVSPFTFAVWIALIIHEIEQKMVKITHNLLVFQCNFVFDFYLSLKNFLFEGTLMEKKVEQNCYEIKKKNVFTLIRALFFDGWNCRTFCWVDGISFSFR